MPPCAILLTLVMWTFGPCTADRPNGVDPTIYEIEMRSRQRLSQAVADGGDGSSRILFCREPTLHTNRGHQSDSSLGIYELGKQPGEVSVTLPREPQLVDILRVPRNTRNSPGRDPGCTPLRLMRALFVDFEGQQERTRYEGIEKLTPEWMSHRETGAIWWQFRVPHPDKEVTIYIDQTAGPASVHCAPGVAHDVSTNQRRLDWHPSSVTHAQMRIPQCRAYNVTPCTMAAASGVNGGAFVIKVEGCVNCKPFGVARYRSEPESMFDLAHRLAGV